MQKKTLAIALATLFALPVVAHADVVIYGFMAGSVESAKASGGDKPVASTTRVNSDNARIGFKGNEDLGNGLKAVWQVENSLDRYDVGGTDGTRTNTWAQRNSFVGLSDATLGTILLGQYDSAYKRLTDTGQDLMVNTTAGNQGASQIFSRGEARYKNSISYTTSNLSGLVLGASFAADEASTSNNRWSVAAQYTLDGLKIGAGYDQQKNPEAGTDKKEFYKLSASYKIADTLLIGGYEWARADQAVGNDLKQNDWTLGVQQNIGAGSVRLSYGALGKADGKSNADDYKASQWILGGTYNLSKLTQAYAYATKINNNAKQKASFAINPLTGLEAGSDPQAIGAGIRVNF
ncbi:porin [Craterilacuibacter sinensis]|uniref:Porin n=1 Tax=Craterilacuibacter sinensis TaxID=2686017 RepID=A0A845BN93_9NEIS|nr:porin [Craterilacuibacter sinensis]MXR37825.1 porin [Craterilacuibacter sinensis]